MEGTYTVYYGKDAVGKVQLIRQGLYYRVTCLCRKMDSAVLRLYGETAGHREKLGVLLPEGDVLRLDKRIPAKRLKEGEIRFVLSSGTADVRGRFVPICPEEPFAYIEQLKDGFLATENGRIGVRIPEGPEAF